MEAGPIGGPGLRAVVGEDSIDVALVPIPHRPGAEKNALGPASSGDTVGTDLAQNVWKGACPVSSSRGPFKCSYPKVLSLKEGNS